MQPLTNLIKRNQAMLKGKRAIQPMQGGDKPENTLVVVRHGSTTFNAESDERVRGWLDLPLSEDGFKEIQSSIPDLKKANIDGIVTSDFTRTVQTATEISKATGIPILGKSPALRPWHLGIFTGQPVKEVLPEMQDYIKNRPNDPVPGGESFNQFKQRVLTYIQQIQNQYPKDKIAIVTHHRNERLITAWVQAGKPKLAEDIPHEPFMHKGIPPGSFTDFEVPPKPVQAAGSAGVDQTFKPSATTNFNAADTQTRNTAPNYQ